MTNCEPSDPYDTSESVHLCLEGLFIHDIDQAVPEVPEDFFPELDEEPADPSPANRYINDSFKRSCGSL